MLCWDIGRFSVSVTGLAFIDGPCAAADSLDCLFVGLGLMRLNKIGCVGDAEEGKNVQTNIHFEGGSRIANSSYAPIFQKRICMIMEEWVSK